MRRGDRGSDVRNVQRVLKAAGYYDGRIDGIYGGRTEKAVMDYQRDHDLTVDGIAGPHTLGRMAINDHPRTLTPLEQAVRDALPHAPITNIQRYLPLVLAGLKRFDLAGKQWLSMAIGTIAAETAGFEPIDEGVSRYNTDDEAFDRYNGRLGNVNPGDGSRFRGRGFVQLTGRANYRHIGGIVGVDLEAMPHQANDPETAANVLAAFLSTRRKRIEQALQSGDLTEAREAVNGGRHGLARFKAAYNHIQNTEI